MSARRRSAGLAALVAAAISLTCMAPGAEAEFGPIQLLSKSTLEQAQFAAVPALSADGRYVAFTGLIGGHEGIFREDVTTGEIELVVAESLREVRPPASISADGRYVAFTTRQALDPVDDLDEDSDVYVADMSTVPATYELASALDGCRPGSSETPCGLTYGGEKARDGSSAAGRVALSADGRRVAFVVHVPSNLAGPETPADQVAVRDLDTHRTYLISVARGTGSPVVGGGADERTPGAAISADGSTVAWVGRHLPEQVPMLKVEAEKVEALEAEPAVNENDRSREYLEPLWRRVPTPSEPDPATRRVVGGGDPPAPGCPPDGSFDEAACRGPFPDLDHTRGEERSVTLGLGWGTILPQLSADGELVATIGAPEEDTDLFVVDMAPGLSRNEAVRRVTQWTNLASEERRVQFGGPYSAQIAELAVSPDGNKLAFTTLRQVFPLAPPTLVTPAPSGPSQLKELYQVNLAGGTIERITPGGDASISLRSTSNSGIGEGGASSPSYGEDGRLLAFSSDAYNLVDDDTNSETDVFMVESDPPHPVLPSTVSPSPPKRTPSPGRFSVHAVSRPDGSIGLVVAVPAAGTLRAVAAAPVGPRLKTRRVASLQMRPALGSVLRTGLRLPRSLRSLAHRMDGLYARIDVAFTPVGGKPQRDDLAGRFRVHPKNKDEG